MSTPRQSTALMDLNGTLLQHPEIKRARAREPKQKLPIGDPPKFLEADEKAIWREVLHNAPLGVLTASDRMVLEIICRLFAKFRRREPLNGPEWSRLSNGLSLIGFTPADRSRIIVGDTLPTNPFSEFRVVQ